jgi:DNA-binding transcriptional ArsR family regulator
MRARELKDGVYGQLARIGKAVSAPKRIELLELLCQGPRTVESLASLADLSVANASQHLQVLRRAHLVEAQKQGLYVEYRLADPQVSSFVGALSDLADARLAEIGALTLSHRYKTNHSHFGMARYVIDFSAQQPQILNKYVVLKNDYIHQVIDIYHV